jgi:dipeptidyl aminopeptidase/acylaminoacyl peptidase
MSEHGADYQRQLRDSNHTETDVETMLETRIAHVLHDQAEHVQFTPFLREKIMRRVTPHPRPSFAFAPAFILAAALVVLLALATYLFYPLLSTTPRVASVQYQVTTSLNTPDALAHGGVLLSLDPTQQHFVYQNANEPGVMYTANLSDPTTSNVLAMRYAHNATWAPNGSALVTTIYPAGVTAPLLALVHTGHYMDTLGHVALAASWSPTSNQEIVFVTQQNTTAQLWSTTPQKGQAATLLTTIQLPASSLVQRLLWSPDGHTLALIIAQGNAPSSQFFNQAGNALFIVDMKTNTTHQLSLASDASIGNVQWSPNGHYLTYEQAEGANVGMLHTLDIKTQHEAFTLKLRHTLLGWNWSPDSNALVYSDDGVLSAHVLQGKQITFPKTNVASPLWLHDGRILALDRTNGTGKLEIFSQTH